MTILIVVLLATFVVIAWIVRSDPYNDGRR